MVIINADWLYFPSFLENINNIWLFWNDVTRQLEFRFSIASAIFHQPVKIINIFIYDTWYVSHISLSILKKKIDVNCNNKPKLTCQFRFKWISNSLSTNQTELHKNYTFQLRKRRSSNTFSIIHSLIIWENVKWLDISPFPAIHHAVFKRNYVKLVQAIFS